MSWEAMMRASEAAARRSQRQEEAQLRLLQRQAKESAKSSALEQARLEVALYEAHLSMLLSVHKDPGTTVDWRGIAASLPPAHPSRASHRELRAKQDEILAAAGLSDFATTGYIGAAADARGADDRDHQVALELYASSHDDWSARQALARRVLDGDITAFQETLAEWTIFSGAPDICAAVTVAVLDRHLADVQLLVKGREILPAETKALTSTGKVSVKPTPKARFHEMFQDYVASCVIRASRELFGLLPFDTVLVTAFVPAPEPTRMQLEDGRPVLSVIFPRDAFSVLPFDSLDPSDTVEAFTHRGEVKVSRKTGEFVPVVPFTRGDLSDSSLRTATLEETIDAARALRERLEEQLAGLTEDATATNSPASEEE
jgi:hypothetical protein